MEVGCIACSSDVQEILKRPHLYHFGQQVGDSAASYLLDVTLVSDILGLDDIVCALGHYSGTDSLAFSGELRRNSLQYLFTCPLDHANLRPSWHSAAIVHLLIHLGIRLSLPN